MRARPAGALALLIVLILFAPGVTAHAVLLSSSPAKGMRLDSPPASVSVTLTEPVEHATLQVLDAAGDRVDLDDLRVDGGSTPTLHVSLPADLPDGAYRMVWRATSVDTHTTSGTVGFAVGDFAPPASSDARAQGSTALVAAGRALAATGVALLLGGAVFLSWVPGAASVPRRPVLEALALGACLHLLGVGVLLASFLDQAAFATASPWATSLGKAMFVRLVSAAAAFLFALLALWPRNPSRLGAHAAVLLGLASALAGAAFTHASASAGVAGTAVDAMHLVAGTAWAGGLLVFLWLLRAAGRGGWASDQVRLAGVRFGTAALACVAVLLMAGLGATLAILGPALLQDPGLLATGWGAILLAKLGLTGLMVALGAVNRYGILEPPASTGFSARMQRLVTRTWPDLRVLDGAAALRRLMRFEAALGVATLALAGLLAAVSPPLVAATPVGTYQDDGSGEEFHGTLAATPWPMVGGTSRLVVHVETHAGAPVEGNTCGREPPLSCVTARIGGAGGESHALRPLGGGDWTVDGILWTAAGDVTVTVAVSTSEVFADEVGFVVHVRDAD